MESERVTCLITQLVPVNDFDDNLGDVLPRMRAGDVLKTNLVVFELPDMRLFRRDTDVVLRDR